MSAHHHRLTVTAVWIVLCVLTGYSLSMGGAANAGDIGIGRYAFSLILLVAFIKARLVIMHLMEIGRAPWALRALFEGWVVVTFLILTALFNGTAVTDAQFQP